VCDAASKSQDWQVHSLHETGNRVQALGTKPDENQQSHDYGTSVTASNEDARPPMSCSRPADRTSIPPALRVERQAGCSDDQQGNGNSEVDLLRSGNQKFDCTAVINTGLERNSDIVVMAWYAPLFVNVPAQRLNLTLGGVGSNSHPAQVQTLKRDTIWATNTIRNPSRIVPSRSTENSTGDESNTYGRHIRSKYAKSISST
jgi:hypothetical protein